LRSDALYLADLLEAADGAAEFIRGMNQEAFLGNKMARSAVLQQLTGIGEAAARLSPDFKSRHPEVVWADIVAFRNIAVHAYFAVDWATVWVTATEDVPGLRQSAAAILKDEFPDVRPEGMGR
jgi:uncharacterized protein with HEPN domain